MSVQPTAAPETTGDTGTTGQDETGQVSVSLSSSRHVTGVAINGLPDPLRTPAGLSHALGRAYLTAVTAQMDERAPVREAAREGRRPIASTERTPAPPRSAHFGHIPADQLREFWKRPVPDARMPGRREVGVSANRCVQVLLHTTDHFAEIDTDPGWLQTARVSAVAAAVLEAFEDAYTQRNSR